MKELFLAVIITFVLIFTASFANHFVNAGYSLLFAIYCTVTAFYISFECFDDTKEEYEFMSITDNA